MAVRWLLALVLVVLVVLPGWSGAQSWPAKPVRIVVPFAAGGIFDSTIRTVATRLADQWGQAVVVENMPGVAGIRGTEYVVRAPPDGYVLGAGSAGIHATNKLLFPKLPYDTDRDLTPIILLTRTPTFLVVHPSVPVASMQEFVAFARANPGKVAYGSTGSGSPQHLAMEMLRQRTGIEVLHVPYKGAAALMPDLLAGQIQAAIDSTAIQHVRTGRLKVIAVAAPQRFAAEPTIPSFGEAGLPDIDVPGWFTLFGPPNLARDLVTRINAEVNKALASPEVQKRLAEWNSVAVGGPPEALVAFSAAQSRVFAEVIRAGNIRAE